MKKGKMIVEQTVTATIKIVSQTFFTNLTTLLLPLGIVSGMIGMLLYLRTLDVNVVTKAVLITVFLVAMGIIAALSFK